VFIVICHSIRCSVLFFTTLSPNFQSSNWRRGTALLRVSECVYVCVWGGVCGDLYVFISFACFCATFCFVSVCCLVYLSFCVRACVCMRHTCRLLVGNLLCLGTCVYCDVSYTIAYPFLYTLLVTGTSDLDSCYHYFIGY
jgi:hypothetical protein